MGVVLYSIIVACSPTKIWSAKNGSCFYWIHLKLMQIKHNTRHLYTFFVLQHLVPQTRAHYQLAILDPLLLYGYFWTWTPYNVK